MHLHPSALPTRHASMAPRLLAATLGGYLLCISLMGALQAVVPGLDAALLTLLPFLICAATTFWAFAARDAWLAWLVLLLPAAAGMAVMLLRLPA